MKKCLEAYYLEHIQKQLFAPIPSNMFPLKMTMEFHYPIGVGNWDIDNKWIYTKAFMDCLNNNNYIPEDNVLFVHQAPFPSFHPIEDKEQRKQIIVIEKSV